MNTSRQVLPAANEVTQTQTTSSLAYVYVACGARSDSTNLLVETLPQAYYVGFEPDPEECARLQQLAKENYQYFPVAIGQRLETRKLYLTHDRSFSSLYAPNQIFLDQFMGYTSMVAVEGELEVQTVSLDDYLPTVGVYQADFLEVDTQGTELEILRGAESFLTTSVVGLKVEVEFSPLYQNQPLFAEVDTYLRQAGFMLFDLSREYYRRKVYPADHDTRGQLTWGDAFYLKDYRLLVEAGKMASAIKLAHTAAFYGFRDYALEIVEALLSQCAGSLGEEESNRLARIREHCLSRNDSGLVKALLKLKRPRLMRFLHKLGALSWQFFGAYEVVRRRGLYSWGN